MELVVDANILFSALIRDGHTAELLLSKNLALYAPEYLLEEMDRYRAFLLEKTHRSAEDFDGFLEVLGRLVHFIPKEDLKEWADEAKRLSPDPDDIPYFALALKLGCGIWSNDARLKQQDTVPIISTKELRP